MTQDLPSILAVWAAAFIRKRKVRNHVQEKTRRRNQARAARRALKEAEERELLSAKKALGEAVAGAVFADALRRVLGVNNTENDALEEPEEDPQWGSDEGDDQPGSHDAYASF